MEPPLALAIGLLLLLLSVAIAADEYVDMRFIYVSGNESSVHDESCWEGGIEEPCATLALGLKGVQNYTELIIEPGNYTLEGNEGNFILLHNVTIMSDGGTVTVVCNDSQSAGLSFEYSRDITISGIIFDGCGQRKNTTSSAQNDTFMETNVSLYFLYCENVHLDSVTVRNIQSGIGVIMYNLVGNITIEYCTIENCGNGGLYIEYSYCVPDTFNDTTSGINCLQYQESNVVEQYTRSGMFVIDNSMFIGNDASLPSDLKNTDTFILPHKQNHNAFGRGGGISAFFKGHSTDNDILITNCNFTNNTALWGGGIFAEFQDSVTNTSFTVNSSFIQFNKVEIGGPTNDSKRNVGTGGGGSRVGFIYFDDFNASNNSIVFDSCKFESNEAYFGGGISLYSARQPSRKYGYNNFSIINCHFDGNRGRIGSGADLSTWHASNTGAVLAPKIDSCTFTNNRYFTGAGNLIGIGAVYVDTLHARFYGSNLFENNNGSALAVTGGYITMMKDCSTRFSGNTGRNGGGIALLGNTYIIMSSNSSLEFINNTAKYHGGAIYFFSSGERDLVSSRNCFIRYYNVSLTPNEWNSSFTFEDNKLVGGKSNSIYTSSVLPCLWGGAFGNAYVNSSHDSNVFCWDNWEYFFEGINVNCSEQIDSAAFHFTDNSKTELTNQIPGKVPINLRDLLQVQNEQEVDVTNSSIFIASIVSNATSNDYLLGKNKSISYMYITHEELYLYANKEGKVHVQLETLDPTVVQKTVMILFKKCPAGFFLKDFNGCICLEEEKENEDYKTVYKEFLICNRSSYSSMLIRGGWLGSCLHSNDTDSFCVGETPFMNRFHQSHRPKSDPYIDLANFTNTDNICKLVNRSGTLCGNCVPGYCMDINSEIMECVNETNILEAKLNIPGWFLYIITEFVPVTIFFFVVFIFSVTVTSGPLNSFIFFAQVITTSVKIEADGMIPISYWLQPAFKYFRYAYHIPYDLWNLDFKTAIPVSVCLGHGSGLLWLSLGYITALYPLLLLIILFVCLVLYNRGTRFIVCIFRPFHNCCSRLRQYTGLRQSIAGGVAIFIIISYTKFARISNQLLSSSLLRGLGSNGERVFYIDGTKTFPKEGIIYVVLACVVLSTFIAIPPILLAYPTVLDIVRKFIVRDRVSLHRLYPNHQVQVFLNEFHGCYRDGSNGGIDCRWFASLYFCLRVIMFTMYAQTPDWMDQYLAQTILFIVTACMFAVIRPYRRDWINSLDTLMFANLAIISVFEMFFYRDVKNYTHIKAAVPALQLILVFLPLVYCIGFYVKLVVLPLVSQCCKAVANRYKRRAMPVNDTAGIDNIGYGNNGVPMLEDSTHVTPFLDFVEDGRRTHAGLSWNRRRNPAGTTQLGAINSQQGAINSQQSDSSCDSRESERTPLITPDSGAMTNSINEKPTTLNSTYGSSIAPGNSKDSGQA